MAVTEGGSGADLVTSVLRASEILSLFSPSSEFLSINEVTQATGLNRTTVYRLVNTLIEAGFLERVDDGRLAVSWRVYRIGASAYSRRSFRDIVRSKLSGLAREFGDTAFFMMPEGGSVLCVDLVIGDSPLQINGMHIGSSLPLHCGAAPLAMLPHSSALRDALFASGLESFTSNTLVAPEALQREIDNVRERGFAVSEEDFMQGVSAVSAAVLVKGELLGAISLGGSASRFGDIALREKGAAVVEAASALSEQLLLFPESFAAGSALGSSFQPPVD